MKQLSTIFIFLIVFISTTSAQTDIKDTAYNPLKPVMHNSSWCVRICNGIQRSYYFDLGISRDYFIGSQHGFYGSSFYLAYSMFPSFSKGTPSVYGIKGGAELWGNGFGLGFDMGYFSNNLANDFIITPKIGIGISMLNIVYGYGFSTNKSTIGRIGKHTVALQIDLPFIKKNKLIKRPVKKDSK